MHFQPVNGPADKLRTRVKHPNLKSKRNKNLKVLNDSISSDSDKANSQEPTFLERISANIKQNPDLLAKFSNSKPKSKNLNSVRTKPR